MIDISRKNLLTKFDVDIYILHNQTPKDASNMQRIPVALLDHVKIRENY